MRGLYIHIPFCESKCPYCDFYSKSGCKELEELYIEALIKRISMIDNKSFDTIYIGGGTPSSLDAANFSNLLEGISKLIDIDSVLEYTIEMNPNSVSAEKVKIAKEGGVNRASLGVQSFNENELKKLGRLHDRATALNAIDVIRKNGIDNLSIDLMYALPGQTICDFQKTLEIVKSLEVEHVSGYCLKLEDGTPMMNDYEAGKFELPDDDLTCDMYFLMCNFLKSFGFEHYEVSNFAKENKRALHNSLYWDQSEYIGIGAGAHSLSGKKRYFEVADIEKYIKLTADGGEVCEVEEFLSSAVEHDEYIMLRLRTRDGIDFKEFEHRFGYRFENRFLSKIQRLVAKGYAENSAGRFYLTDRGMFVSNSVISEFI